MSWTHTHSYFGWCYQPNYSCPFLNGFKWGFKWALLSLPEHPDAAGGHVRTPSLWGFGETPHLPQIHYHCNTVKGKAGPLCNTRVKSQRSVLSFHIKPWSRGQSLIPPPPHPSLFFLPPALSHAPRPPLVSQHTYTSTHTLLPLARCTNAFAVSSAPVPCNWK